MELSGKDRALFASVDVREAKPKGLRASSRVVAVRTGFSGGVGRETCRTSRAPPMIAGMDPTEIACIAADHRILLILQFGSSVSGKLHERSDIDIAVQFDGEPAGLSARAALIADLQALFPDNPVDLVILNHADPLLLKKVMETCRLLYGDLHRYHNLRILAYKRFQDHRRFLAMERDYVRRALQKVVSDDRS